MAKPEEGHYVVRGRVGFPFMMRVRRLHEQKTFAQGGKSPLGESFNWAGLHSFLLVRVGSRTRPRPNSCLYRTDSMVGADDRHYLLCRRVRCAHSPVVVDTTCLQRGH